MLGSHQLSPQAMRRQRPATSSDTRRVFPGFVACRSGRGADTRVCSVGTPADAAPAGLPAQSGQMNLDTDVWQPILAAGGLSGRPRRDESRPTPASMSWWGGIRPAVSIRAQMANLQRRPFRPPGGLESPPAGKIACHTAFAHYCLPAHRNSMRSGVQSLVFDGRQGLLPRPDMFEM